MLWSLPRKCSRGSHHLSVLSCWPFCTPLLHYFPNPLSFCHNLWDVKLVFSFLQERLRTTWAPHTPFGKLWSSANGWQWNWWASSHSFMIGQVPVCRLKTPASHKARQNEAYMESAWRLFPPTLTGALTSPAARCSCPPAFVLVSLRRCLCMNAVFIPQRLLLHFTAKGTTECTGSGCGVVGKWPVCAPLCTSPSRVDRTWQARLAVCSLRGGGSEM